MRAIVIREYGGTDVLKVEDDVASPQVSSGEVEISVHAAGLNFADVMARLGHYKRGTPIPYVGGFEVAGIVTSVAPDVAGLAVGDRVAAMTRRGGFAERIAVDSRDAIKLPDSMSYEEGATIPVGGTTAWAALVSYGNVQPGERVLIKAAAGGVGVMAVQIAKHAGAQVWGAASPRKHGMLRQLGVDHIVDYTAQGWEANLPRFDLILDAIGGDSFARSYRMLRPGGRLVMFGAASAFDKGKRDVGDAEVAPDFRVIEGVDSSNLMIDSKSLIGFDQRVLWDDRGTIQPWLAPLRVLLDQGALGGIVSAVLPFTEAARAHDLLVSRSTAGKVVLVP